MLPDEVDLRRACVCLPRLDEAAEVDHVVVVARLWRALDQPEKISAGRA